MLVEMLAVLLTAASHVTYSRPVPGAVVAPFDAPPTPYSAGHRGVDLLTAAGASVRTAAAGDVTFAGEVAGRGVVVVRHADGIRTEYEPVTPLVVRGQHVIDGEVIALADAQTLHWGARHADDSYFDPLTLLPSLGPVRLIPWDG